MLQLADLGYEVMDASEFFISLSNEDPNLFQHVLNKQYQHYRERNRAGHQLITDLHHAHCSIFANYVNDSVLGVAFD